MNLARAFAVLVLLAWTPVEAGSPEKEAQKAEKKAEKKTAKAEKQKGKQAKHFMKDQQRVAEGEIPQHHEVGVEGIAPAAPTGELPPQQGFDYQACVDYLQREVADKEFEQQKHAIKDQNRVAKGEAPEHMGEPSMTTNYRNDPKFDVVRICGEPPATSGTHTLTFGEDRPQSKATRWGLRYLDELSVKAAPRWASPLWFFGLWSGVCMAFVVLFIAKGFHKARGPAEEALLAGTDSAAV